VLPARYRVLDRRRLMTQRMLPVLGELRDALPQPDKHFIGLDLAVAVEVGPALQAFDDGSGEYSSLELAVLVGKLARGRRAEENGPHRLAHVVGEPVHVDRYLAHADWRQPAPCPTGIDQQQLAARQTLNGANDLVAADGRGAEIGRVRFRR